MSAAELLLLVLVVASLVGVVLQESKKTLKPATEAGRINVTSSQWQACAIQSKGDERTCITSSG